MRADTTAEPAVDLTRPILAQVGPLGDAYDRWVHDPVTPRTAERRQETADAAGPARWSGSLRIFESDWLESMSHTAWWFVPIIWLPISATLFAVGGLGFDLAPLRGVAYGAVGLLLWTLVEYLLHRFVFHHRPRSAFGRRLHFLAHGVHHLDPWDRTRLVFPPVAGVAISALLFGLAALAFGLALAFPVIAGLLVGYVVYDLTHYYTHHARPKGRLGKFLKAYHLAHHHRHWNAMFGVSNPFWDVVFRTGRPKASR